MTKLMRYIWIVALLLFGVGGTIVALAQELTPVPDESVPLQITAVSAADFPTVQIQLASADPAQPLPTDLDGLRLREAGQDIVDFETTPLTVGVDLVLVVDANEAMLVVDDEEDGRSRWRNVEASLNQFAARFMQPAGANSPDRVSVIVPDAAGSDGRFLVQDATAPDELSAAIDGYDLTDPPFTTPLANMLDRAIFHLAAGEDGRYRAILLYTNGAQLNQQLDFAELVVAAQEAGIPIFAAIIGSQADPEEIGNVTRLTEPTRGDYVHMPGTAAPDSFYQLWRRQGQQFQITYRSRQNESGTVEVTAVLDNRQAAASYTVEVASPSVSIRPPRTITRQGETPQTAPAELEPARVMVPVRVAWSGGRPRSITAVSLLVNGQSQAQFSAPDLAPGEGWEVPWDVSALEAGTYTLTVQIRDDLGLTAESDPVPVTVSLVRSTLAPATASPPEAAPRETGPALGDDSVLPIAAAGVVLVLLLLTLGQWWRGRRGPAPAMETPDILPGAVQETAVSSRAASSRSEADPVAYLQPVDATLISGMLPLRLEEDDITLGRDPEMADLVINHESVDRLHARIRRTDDTYWLYDEGSGNGTYLDFERLGLGPRMLYDQNRIRLGRVRLIFRLRPGAEPPEAADSAGEDRA